jgi:hypothetical protein
VRAVLVLAYLVKSVVAVAVAVAGLVAGSLAAWYETAVLLGRLPTAWMLLGIGLVALFLAFAVAVVALGAAWSGRRSWLPGSRWASSAASPATWAGGCPPRCWGDDRAWSVKRSPRLPAGT